MAYFDFYAGEIPDQQIEELDSIMAVYEKAGVRPFDAALQAVRDMLVRAQNNKVEIERLILEAAKGTGKKFMGGKLVLQHSRTMDAGGMELHYLRHITYNSVGGIESETYSDDYGFGITAKTLPELKKKMSKHGKVVESILLLAEDEDVEYIFESTQPNEFIKAPNGSINFGEITAQISNEIHRQAGFIRLRQGDAKYGETHINRKDRLKQLRQNNYEEAKVVAFDLAQHYNAIYKGDGRTLLLVKKQGLVVLGYIQLEAAEDGDYYDIKSALVSRADFLKHKKPLWERAQSNQSLSTPPSAVTGQSDSLSVSESTLPPDFHNVKPILEAAFDYKAEIEKATTFEEIKAVWAVLFPAKEPTVVKASPKLDELRKWHNRQAPYGAVTLARKFVESGDTRDVPAFVDRAFNSGPGRSFYDNKAVATRMAIAKEIDGIKIKIAGLKASVADVYEYKNEKVMEKYLVDTQTEIDFYQQVVIRQLGKLNQYIQERFA